MMMKKVYSGSSHPQSLHSVVVENGGKVHAIDAQNLVALLQPPIAGGKSAIMDLNGKSAKGKGVAHLLDEDSGVLKAATSDLQAKFLLAALKNVL
jgi:hypothetical protein